MFLPGAMWCQTSTEAVWLLCSALCELAIDDQGFDLDATASRRTPLTGQ